MSSTNMNQIDSSSESEERIPSQDTNHHEMEPVISGDAASVGYGPTNGQSMLTNLREVFSSDDVEDIPADLALMLRYRQDGPLMSLSDVMEAMDGLTPRAHGRVPRPIPSLNSDLCNESGRPGTRTRRSNRVTFQAYHEVMVIADFREADDGDKDDSQPMGNVEECARFMEQLDLSTIIDPKEDGQEESKNEED